MTERKGDFRVLGCSEASIGSCRQDARQGAVRLAQRFGQPAAKACIEFGEIGGRLEQRVERDGHAER
jgi:hypothetical protein